jgi:hypothetical protein
LREPAITGDGLGPRGRGEVGGPRQRGPQSSDGELRMEESRSRVHSPATTRPHERLATGPRVSAPYLQGLGCTEELAKWAELGIVGPGEFPSLFLFIFYFFSFFSIFKSKFEFKFKFITTTYVCGFRGINSGYILFIYIIYIFHIIFPSSPFQNPKFYFRDQFNL